MSGTKILLDTNIILYLLNGDEKLVDLLEDAKLYISIITEIELLSYKNFKESEKKQIKLFLSSCTIINITDEIKSQAINLKSNSFLKLPDSIIAATSFVMDIPLITADKQFKTIDKLNLLYYTI